MYNMCTSYQTFLQSRSRITGQPQSEGVTNATYQSIQLPSFQSIANFCACAVIGMSTTEEVPNTEASTRERLPNNEDEKNMVKNISYAMIPEL